MKKIINIKPQLLIMLISFIYSEITYSNIDFLSSKTLKNSQFYQLESQEIIGISEDSYIKLKKYNKKYYQISPKENKFNFTLSSMSKNVYTKKINNNVSSKFNKVIYIPCIKYEDNIYLLGQIDLLNEYYNIFQLNLLNSLETTQQYCNLFPLSNKQDDIFILSYIEKINKSQNQNSSRVILYLFNSNSNSLNLIDEIQDENYTYYDNSLFQCLYFEAIDYIFCLRFNNINKLIINFIIIENNNTDDNYKFEPLNQGIFPYDLNINFHNGDNTEYVVSTTMRLIKYNTIILITFSNYNFVIHYILAENINNITFYNNDNEKFVGNYENYNLIIINEDYFIVTSTYSFKLYLFLFNVNEKKCINDYINNHFYSSFNFILKGYYYNEKNIENNNLIIVNQIMNKNKLEIYEYNLIECSNNFFNVESYKETLINIDLLYKSINNEKLKNVQISFYDIDNSQNESLKMQGKLVDSSNLEDVQIGLEYFYTEIYYKLEGNKEYLTSFKYILQVPFRENVQIEDTNLNNNNFMIPSFLCNSGFAFFCYDSCKYCTTLGDETTHSCTECKENYNIFYINSTISSNFNCYEGDIKGYYLEQNVYKKCYDTCSYCYSEGNITNNNCKECKEGYILLSNYDNRYTNNCVEYCNINLSRWYIDNETNEFNCLHNINECPDNYSKYNSSSGECQYFIRTQEEMEIAANKNYYNLIVKSLEYNNASENHFSYDVNFYKNYLLKMPYLFFEPLMSSINKEDFSYYFYKINISSISNEYNKSRNVYTDNDILLLTINFSECDSDLFNINDTYVYVAILELVNGYPTNQMEYSFFYDNLTYMNISQKCKGKTINIYHKVKMENLYNNDSKFFDYSFAKEKYEKYSLDLYNKKDRFYNDFCINSREFGITIDIPISQRINYFYSNVTLCDNNCTFMNINYRENTVNCSCEIKGFLNTTLEYRTNYLNSFNVEISNFGLKYIKCIKNIKRFGSIGLAISIIMIVAVILTLFYGCIYLNKKSTVEQEINEEDSVKKRQSDDKISKYNNDLNINELNINNQDIVKSERRVTKYKTHIIKKSNPPIKIKSKKTFFPTHKQDNDNNLGPLEHNNNNRKKVFSKTIKNKKSAFIDTHKSQGLFKTGNERSSNNQLIVPNRNFISNVNLNSLNNSHNKLDDLNMNSNINQNIISNMDNSHIPIQERSSPLNLNKKTSKEINPIKRKCQSAMNNNAYNTDKVYKLKLSGYKSEIQIHKGICDVEYKKIFCDRNRIAILIINRNKKLKFSFNLLLFFTDIILNFGFNTIFFKDSTLEKINQQIIKNNYQTKIFYFKYEISRVFLSLLFVFFTYIIYKIILFCVSKMADKKTTYIFISILTTGVNIFFFILNASFSNVLITNNNNWIISTVISLGGKLLFNTLISFLVYILKKCAVKNKSGTLFVISEIIYLF